MSPPFAPEIEEVLDRAAAIPRGLAFLHLAPLETVAITLEVDARLVERVRGRIEDPATHAEVIAVFKRAVARWKSGTHPAGFREPEPAPPDLGPEELIRAADEHALGLTFLAEGPPETVAVIFGVHFDVVLEARALLERRGAAHDGD